MLIPERLILFAAVVLIALLALIIIRRRRKAGAVAPDITLARSFEKLLNGTTADVLIELRNLYADSHHDVGVGLALGTVLRKKGDFKAAIRLHRSLVKRSELDTQMQGYVLTELCADYLACGLFDRAKQAIDRASELSKGDDWFFTKAAQTYVKLGLWDGACQILRRMSHAKTKEINRQVSLVREQQGQKLMDAGSFKEALSAFKMAVQADADCVPAHLNISRVYREMEKPEKARQYLAKHEGKFADYYWLFLNELRKVMVQLGRHQVFFDYAETRIKDEPSDWRSRMVMARFMGRLGSHKEAFSHLLKCVEQAPNVLLIHQSIWDLLVRNPGFVDEFGRYGKTVERSLVFSHPFECYACRFSQETVFWKCPSCFKINTCHERRI